MNDLQKARADWLDAESRCLKLQKENSDLGQRVFELEMKLVVSQARAESAEVMLTASVRAMLTG
jgi:hypothetical protein